MPALPEELAKKARSLTVEAGAQLAQELLDESVDRDASHDFHAAGEAEITNRTAKYERGKATS